VCNGDARIALNLLELAVLTSGGTVTLEKASELLRERRLRYDKSSEQHYDTVSAFIKSLRGSDPDAALLWMYSMLDAGEDPRFLFRRMAIFASEDIGTADTHALQVVVSAWQAFELVGFPEGEYFLAHACLYLGQASKSNAVAVAMAAVKKFLQSLARLVVPNHLRNAPIPAMKSHGVAQGYAYPHDFDGALIASHYFPASVPPTSFYNPSDRGMESQIRERLQKARSVVRRADIPPL
jgi:putative ATPase